MYIVWNSDFVYLIILIENSVFTEFYMLSKSRQLFFEGIAIGRKAVLT